MVRRWDFILIVEKLISTPVLWMSQTFTSETVRGHGDCWENNIHQCCECLRHSMVSRWDFILMVEEIISTVLWMSQTFSSERVRFHGDSWENNIHTSAANVSDIHWWDSATSLWLLRNPHQCCECPRHSPVREWDFMVIDVKIISTLVLWMSQTFTGETVWFLHTSAVNVPDIYQWVRFHGDSCENNIHTSAVNVPDIYCHVWHEKVAHAILILDQESQLLRF